MKRYRYTLNQAGDTIVEVVLALTVLGLVLGGASVLANKSSRSLQDAQEHNAGLRIAQAQLEYIKTYAAEHKDELANGSSDVRYNGGFCMADNASGGVSPVRVDGGEAAKCKVNAYGAPTTDEPAYTIATTVTEESDGYNLRTKVTWDSIQGTTNSSELTYRIYTKLGAAVAVNPGDGCPAGYMPDSTAVGGCVRIPPQLKVVVKKIAPDAATGSNRGEQQPSCSKAATQNRAGTSVVLNKLGTNPEVRPPQATGSDSGTLFTDLTPLATYNAIVTDATVPAGFDYCENSQAGVPFVGYPQQIQSSDTFPIVVTVKMRPNCSWSTRQDYLGYYSDYLGYYSDYWGYYSDYLGTYNDPFNFTNWWHSGWDGRRGGWPTYDFYWSEPPYTAYYRWRGDLGYRSSDNSWFYERWVQAPYPHYSAPYNHYSAPYHHYSAPYHHYSAPYQFGTCNT